MENHSQFQKLKYRLIECTTEDSEFPLYELIRGSESSGWMSVRFCTYPQEILLQFLTPVNLKQIHILCNEKKIPSLLEIYYYNPANHEDKNKNFKLASFEKLGYIRMDTNSKTNYKAREFRKIYVDTTCLYLKLVLQKNYVNKYNVFNQVGLINLDFYGTPILYPKNETNTGIKESLREITTEKGIEIHDDHLDEISQEKLKILKTHLEEALKVEDFDEAKKIKKNLDKVRLIAKKIYELETNKKIYISNEDFDNAKIMKFELERLKSNLKYMDKQLASLMHSQSMSLNLNRSIGENNSSLEDNKDPEGSGAFNNTINYQNPQNFNIDETINKEKSFINENREKERIDRESSFSITTDINNVEKSMMNKTKMLLEKIDEEFLPYEDQIIPTVKKKLNTTNVSQILEEFKDSPLIKADLEDVDPKIYNKYSLFIKYIGEDGLKKLFSRNILWKEEGLEDFNKRLPNIFSESCKADSVKSGSEIDVLINLILKMLFLFLCEKHPQTSIRSMDIFETLLCEIKKATVKLNYDINLTDNILIKIKEKLGDVNAKVRNKAVSLYSFMLKQDFCDYHNLLCELIEDEMKRLDIKKVIRSSKMILGKLSIFDQVFKEFYIAVKDKRTDINTFPFNLIATYVIENINHSKSEVRKLDREVIIKICKIFGFKRLEPLIKKVDERELEKLIKDIPEIKELIEQRLKEINTSIQPVNSRNKSPKGEREKSGSPKRDKKKPERKNSTTKSVSPPKFLNCSYCGKFDKKFVTEEDLKEHTLKDCVMFTNCIKCKLCVEVKLYNSHMLNDCVNKEEFKTCKRCKEPIDIKVYDQHVKDNKCNPAKNQNSSGRCPLCHKDIPPQDKGFIQHLVKDICQIQKRREKVTFVNGK